MTDSAEEPTQRMVDGRERLLPEEAAAGSDDPEAQATAVLEESQERTLHPEQTRQDSPQTPGDGRPSDSDGHAGEPR